MSKIRQKLGEFGSRFAFEFYVEFMHDKIIEGLRGYLAPLRPEDVRRMVRKNELPPLDLSGFSLDDNDKYLEKISAVGVLEYLAEARPDLAQVIQDMGPRGAQYVAKLRLHLLELVSHPEKSLAESTEYTTKQDMVKATCDKCGKSWPVPKDEASSIKECPFCQAGLDEE